MWVTLPSVSFVAPVTTAVSTSDETTFERDADGGKGFVQSALYNDNDNHMQRKGFVQSTVYRNNDGTVYRNNDGTNGQR